MTEIPPLRWGILGTARIVRRNWQGMRNSGAAELVAIASRDLEKAQSFINGLQAEFPWPHPPTAFGSYESLIASPEVDAIYIPLPTGVRKEWVIRAAEAGKHVLCEKPCAVSAAELQEMISACARHGVLFMDGVMFMHDPRYQKLRHILDDGTSVGAIRRITSAFSYRAGDDFAGNDIRSQVELEPTGCLGDLGWYCLRATLWAMNWEMPRRVSGRVLDGGTSIMDFSAELDFSGGVTAAFHCSFLAPKQMWFNVSGSEGYVRVPDFISPVADNDTDWELNYKREPRAADPGVGSEALMFARFAAEVAGGAGNSPWAEISMKTQVLLDACERSARTGLPEFLE